MRKSVLFIFAAIFMGLLCGCTYLAPEPPPQSTVTQISTIDALLAGVYDGSVTLEELKIFGNTGIGTFDALDGEMAMLNGEIYQIKADGKVYRPAMKLHTPFASVVDFRPQKMIRFTQPCTYNVFKEKIDIHAPESNLMTAIVVKGTFKSVKTRSVPAQKKPYPPLKEVCKHQPVFKLKNVEGYIVGFRLPAYVKGINVPGYHLHFLSKDKKSGGHILDFEMEEGAVAIQTCDRFYMILPESSTGFNQVDLSKDRSKALRKVEQ